MSKSIRSGRQILASKHHLPPNTHQLTITKDHTRQLTPGSARFLAETFQLNEQNAARGPIQLRRSVTEFQKGLIIIQPGEAFFFVASRKFARSYYIVAIRGERFICSAHDEVVAATCIARVIEFVQANAITFDQDQAA